MRLLEKHEYYVGLILAIPRLAMKIQSFTVICCRSFSEQAVIDLCSKLSWLLLKAAGFH